MTETSEPELAKLSQHYHELLLSQHTLTLSTSSARGVPDISYAPFVRDPAGVFYIFVSEMASHTANLQNNPQASILFIRPESAAHNLFARERAVLNCSAQEIRRDDEVYTLQTHALQDKFGEVVGMLRTLPDFHLFALRPHSGRYVIGFGRAYTINMADDSLCPV